MESVAPDEPPIREFADRGLIWLLEPPANMRGLLAIVANDVAANLDFSRARRKNRSFVPDDLRKEEADLLFSVPYLKRGGEALIYVLIEIQSRPDRAMGLRLLSYMTQLWSAQRREWKDAGKPASKLTISLVIPVVFYVGNRRWRDSLSLGELMDVPPGLEQFVPSHETLFLSLRDTPAEALTHSALGWALRAYQAADDPREALAAVLRDAAAYLESLPESAQAEWRRAMQFLLLLVRHRRPIEEQNSLYNVIIDETLDDRSKEAREMAMTGAQALMAQGRREGRKEGRQEGMREALIDALEVRFGSLAPDLVELINGMSMPEVRRTLRRAMVVETIAELGLSGSNSA